MSKKKSSNSRPTKPAKAKGGIMGLDKSSTSVGMKVIISLLILAFVSTFLYGGISSIIAAFSSSGQSAAPTASTDPVAAASAQYKPQVDALTKVVESEPTSYTPLVNLGNSYYDWAQTVSQASQTSTAAAVTASTLWIAAKDAYGRALKIQPGDSAVTIDYAIATYYSGDASAAIAIAKPVTKSDPKFDQAWLNIAIFYEGAGQTSDAIAAYETFLALKPSNTQSVSFAKAQLKSLKSAATSTTP